MSTASLKLVTDNHNRVLYYSRNIIPWNKNGSFTPGFTYKTFTGIYVFKRDMLALYHTLPNTPLQIEEDCEQLKIIQHGYHIASYPTVEFNEISLNTSDDYEFLVNKYYTAKHIDVKTNKIKLAVFDIDGVFTDGKIYVSKNDSYKCYNGKDTYGLALLRKRGIKIGIITAHDTPIIDNMEHIIKRTDLISKGSYNKLTVLNEWCRQLNITYDEISYIGDDIPDIPILEKVALSGCPNDAISDVKHICKHVCKHNGGNGAVREFCELILNR
jgi:3-deoxy-D-manno-octulosonate 8-phosphate phosphatase (KDO 8-P phosphatase)